MVVVGLSLPVVMTLKDFGILLSDLNFALVVEKAVAKLEELLHTNDMDNHDCLLSFCRYSH